MSDIPKRLKRLLHEYAMQAHEEELRRALLPLSTAFEEWKVGQLSNGELCEMIHKFHQGPARELWKKYNIGILELAVAQAIVSGVLPKHDVPSELLEHLRPAMTFYEQEHTTT